MGMTVGDLMEMLEGFDPETKIRLAQQPGWPFEYSVGNVVEVDGTVYIGEGEKLDYLAGEVRAELGW